MEELEPDLISDANYPKRKRKKGDKKDLEMLSMKELMEQMGIARNTVVRMIERDNFPKPIRLGKSLRCFRKDIVIWLNKRKHQS